MSLRIWNWLGAVLAVSAATLPPAFSKDKSDTGVAVSTKPGTASMTEVTRATGLVESIDLGKRHVTIRTSQGKLIPLEIGPDARNLDQVKPGDRVSVSYAQALTLTLMKDGKEIRSKTESESGTRSAAGERPAGTLGRRIEVTADVIKVDKKAKTITLRGAEHEIDLKVRDPEQLKLIKVGDQVQAVYTEAVALSVDR